MILTDIIGLSVLLIGVVYAIYVGLFVMFVGGIEQAVNALANYPINEFSFAIGVTKVLLSGFVGGAIAFISFVISSIIVSTTH